MFEPNATQSSTSLVHAKDSLPSADQWGLTSGHLPAFLTTVVVDLRILEKISPNSLAGTPAGVGQRRS
jgi:hypothetical protein